MQLYQKILHELINILKLDIIKYQKTNKKKDEAE